MSSILAVFCGCMCKNVQQNKHTFPDPHILNNRGPDANNSLRWNRDSFLTIWECRHLSVKIGIPGSLFYFRFASFWKSFFMNLGLDVVISGPTNRRILDDGVKSCVDETCLPIKLFFGHVQNLKDRVDYILVPRFTSISKNEYICPEFGGLPDMVRHTLKGLPKLIDTEVNMRKSIRGGIRAAVEVGAMLGADRRKTVKAYQLAAQNFRRDQFFVEFAESVQRSGGRPGLVCQKGENCPRFGSGCDGTGETFPRPAAGTAGPSPCRSACRRKLCVGVIGHPYTVYDRYISMDLLGKLARYEVLARTIETVDEADINRQASALAKPMFWNHGRLAYGAALHMAESGQVDGFIFLTSFGCGIDSFVNDLIERHVRRRYSIPLITMTIDEHTGEAGFNTRLEAFIDMLQWRRQNEGHISASG